jgi:glycosyltransferase involved in cell wall biosynthesis
MAGWDRYLAATPSPGLRLVIAGGGPLGGEVSAWAAARPSVAVAGQLSGGDCARLMAGARAVILPSTWEETFGLVAVEAMALGVPPVAAGHGSFPELITDGADGVLFRPGDAAALAAAIAGADAGPRLFRCYGEQARKTYEQRFAPERSIEDLLRIYRFAIAHPA